MSNWDSQSDDYKKELVKRIKQDQLAREILGVGRDADVEQIKKAFRVIVARYHPDKNPGDKEAYRKFINALNAYKLLIGEITEAEFDINLAEIQQGREPKIGKFNANEWGYFCHWRETFMENQ